MEHTLDAKGRVVLPSRDRAKFEDVVNLSMSPDGCVSLLPQEEFEKQFAKYEALDEDVLENRYRRRLWSTGIATVDIDGHGRFAIPPSHQNWAGLKRGSKVLLTGVLGKIELWDPERYEALIGASRNTYASGTASWPSAPGGSPQI